MNLPESLRLHALYLAGHLDGVRADLSGAFLSDADLRDANLRGAALDRADLSDADLSGADLRDADLRDADLHDADLSGADLRGAVLSGASLSGAELSGASLRGAELSGAALRGAFLSGADLAGADLSDADPRWVYATLPSSGKPTVTIYANEAQADQELTDRAYDDDLDPATDFEAWLAAEGGMTAGESAAAYLARNDQAHYYGSPFDVEDFASGPFRRAILDALLADKEV